MKGKLLSGAVIAVVLVALGSIHVAAAPTQVLDQSQTQKNNAFITNFQVGQSFKAEVSGLLTQIDIGFCATQATLTLEIAAGDVAQGMNFPTPIHSQQFTANVTLSCFSPSPTWIGVPLTQGVPVTAGSSYTFQTYGAPKGVFIHGSNPYADGHIYQVGTAGLDDVDIIFRTHVTVDSDGDGRCDPGASEVQCSGTDLCPEAAAASSSGCPVSATDSDADGVCDRGGSADSCEGSDLCSGTPATAPAVDENGCSQAQVDSDLDGVCNRGVSSSLCEGSDRCSRSVPGPADDPEDFVDENGCAQIQVDSNLDGKCNRGVTSLRWCSDGVLIAPSAPREGTLAPV